MFDTSPIIVNSNFELIEHKAFSKRIWFFLFSNLPIDVDNSIDKGLSVLDKHL